MKLIPRPGLCGARVTETPSEPKGTYCTIHGSIFLPCPSIFVFPDKCPLQNGIKEPETIKELVQIAKKQGLLF